MQVNPYLHYNGNCEAAFKFYEKAIGARIEVMMTHEAAPPEMPLVTAMEVPAVALPADPELDPLPTRIAVPPVPADDQPAAGQRLSRLPMNASRSNR